MWSRVGKLMGMDDVEIGSPVFDRVYIIKGSSRAALRELLSRPVQEQIDRLRHFRGNDDIYVSIGRGKMLVKKRSLIRQPADLEVFVQLSIGLYDQAVATLERGIEFVEPGPQAEATEAICQICGEPITSDVVYCRRCKTPHHRDCWEYYGACSTYGCGGKRFQVPKTGRGRKRVSQA
jgi:hypothetical protein